MRKMESLPTLGGALLVLLSPYLLAQDRVKLDRGIRGSRDHDVFVRMADQLFVTAVDYPTFCRENADRKRGELRKQVTAELRKKADASWKLVRSKVEELEKNDAIRNLKRYFVVNGFACIASTEACKELSSHQAVGFVYKRPAGVPSLATRPVRRQARPRQDPKQLMKTAIRMWEKGNQLAFDPDKVTVPWNLKRIQADQVWKQEKVTGKGVTIALLDSGIWITPSLVAALWRNQQERLNGKDDDGNGYIDDIFGWDFDNQSNLVLGDRGVGHGSMCGGIMAARPVDTGKNKIVTGIAPEARLMILRGMGLVEAYEYALTNGASVISMSYMWVRGRLGNWRGLYRLAHEHMTAAGIVSVGGAGNFSRLPRGRQIALPKDIPCVVAAAGLDKTMAKARASSEGPCYWDDVVFYLDYPEDDPLQKPDVTGFFTGYPVWTSVARRLPPRWKVIHECKDGYGLVIGPGGNSFSGPHAGGVAALMLSANTDIPAFRVIELMKKTCKDMGEKGHDTVYGAGLLQALRAVRAVRAVKKQAR